VRKVTTSKKPLKTAQSRVGQVLPRKNTAVHGAETAKNPAGQTLPRKKTTKNFVGQHLPRTISGLRRAALALRNPAQPTRTAHTQLIFTSHG